MLSPKDAWKPLPAKDWNREKARHLASRMGYSLAPEFVDRIEDLGPVKAVQYYLGEQREFVASPTIIGMSEMLADYREAVQKTEDKEARARLRMERNQRSRQAHVEAGIEWYQFARQIENAPQEKLVGFFQNIWVVAYRKVQSPPELFAHKDKMRRNLGQTYPAMAKELGLSPAMVRYLDLQRNRKGRPNENFARELFELFLLGEGNYTEDDIKEAARALTGYHFDREGALRFEPNRFDKNAKTIFGQKGKFDFEGLVDLAFEQPAAARFLPRELCHDYLSESGLPDETLDALADIWKSEQFSIASLVRTFFTSRIFYEPAYRGNMIKSPEHFYLGLLQDLHLDVVPVPRFSYQPLRQMGQAYFDPPNVRGWVGGQKWINSATLSARNRLVQQLFVPINPKRLNADEVTALENAEALGRGRFSVSEDVLENQIQLGDLSAEALAKRFYANASERSLKHLLSALKTRKRSPFEMKKAALIAALIAPEYHLC